MLSKKKREVPKYDSCVWRYLGAPIFVKILVFQRHLVTLAQCFIVNQTSVQIMPSITKRQHNSLIRNFGNKDLYHKKFLLQSKTPTNFKQIISSVLASVEY